jgi:hypothetical protein
VGKQKQSMGSKQGIMVSFRLLARIFPIDGCSNTHAGVKIYSFRKNYLFAFMPGFEVLENMKS